MEKGDKQVLTSQRNNLLSAIDRLNLAARDFRLARYTDIEERIIGIRKEVEEYVTEIQVELNKELTSYQKDQVYVTKSNASF